MKKCFRTGFFKLTHSLKKSMVCVNIAKLQSSIFSLEMCTIYLNNERLSLSSVALAHRNAAHSFVLSITLFHFVPHVLISNKCQKGFSLVSFLGYSNSFFIISQILFSIFEINLYLIIDSKMFGVTFGVNFYFPIVKYSSLPPKYAPV